MANRSSTLNIISMHHAEALREDMREEQWKESERRRKLAASYTELLGALADADPNWEHWWDANIDGLNIWQAAEVIQVRLNTILKDPDLVSRDANCWNCTLAPSMRVCGVCRFHTSIIAHKELVVTEMLVANEAGN